MSERFVIVHRSYDPIQADILGDLLRDSGLNARVTGTRSGAAIGVAQNILEVHIAVPESEAGAATDFLEAYFSAEIVDEPGEPTEDGDAPAGEAAEATREPEIRPLLAAGTAFLTFGVGHLYARRPATAVALFAGQLVAMFFLIAGDGWRDWTIGLTALVAIVACDVIGAVFAARAHRSGVRRGRAWQAGLGAVYVCGSLALAQLVGPHLANPKLGDPTGGWRTVQRKPVTQQVDKPLERDPSFPPLTSQHPANPAARR
jgi:hypothetical protein